MTREGAGKMLDSLNVYHDVDSRSAAMNMAIDEALLEIAAVPSIRFYQWNHPALSFGYFGKFEDVANHHRDIVRRWTGGGIVFHGSDLTYSIVIPASDAAFSESSMSIYEKVHRSICRALIAKGERAVLCGSHAPVARRTPDWPAKDNGPHGPGHNKDACFANPVRADVLLNGRKVAGAAQRRTRRGLLQQGSIQNVDLRNGFDDRFATELCDDFVLAKLDDALISRAEEIAARKYATPSWLRRR